MYCFRTVDDGVVAIGTISSESFCCEFLFTSDVVESEVTDGKIDLYLPPEFIDNPLPSTTFNITLRIQEREYDV